MEKKNIGLKVLVVILSLLVVGLSGFIIYDKVLSNNEVENNDNNNVNTDNNGSKLLSNEEAINEGKRLYDKATEIYETWVLIPYCGVVRNKAYEDENKIEKLGDSGYGNGSYYKSNFTSLDDLKNHLKQWLSEDIVNEKIVKTSVSNGETFYNYVEDVSLLSKKDGHYGYVDYVLKDNTLYCRLDTGKGWLTLYQNKYDIKVDKIEENKITYTITSTYGKQDSGCYLGMLDSKTCEEKDLEYKNTTFVIEKNTTGKFVVSEYTLHD